MSGRVHKAQWIVAHVGVAVAADGRIRLDEACDLRVVKSALIEHQPAALVFLLPGEPSLGLSKERQHKSDQDQPIQDFAKKKVIDVLKNAPILQCNQPCAPQLILVVIEHIALQGLRFCRPRPPEPALLLCLF
ncbi:MAG: hypothetical protein A2V67_00295 [Deltaproteobacteria bacterium RBG_13_61_14]|nr:MAG: hypothetical protein A2V67_00295 [Deltaproteobacteria bacterium RBG_13_61_14]